MNANEIKKHIDELIEKVDGGEMTISPEVADLLDEIVNYATIIKAKDKTKPLEDLISRLDGLIETINNGSTESKESIKISNSELLEAIKQLKIDVASPQVNVAAPEVTVKVPPIHVPPSEITLPKEMSIEKPSWISGLFNLKPITDAIADLKKSFLAFTFPTLAKKPMSVRLSDGEKFYKAIGGLSSSFGGMIPSFTDSDNVPKPGLVSSDGHVQVDVVGGDIQIGAVEIKDGTNNNRADVNDASTARTSATKVIAVQNLDAAGNVITNDTANADGVNNTSTRMPVNARLVGFNGTTWDRIRAGVTGVVSAVTGFINNLPFVTYNSSAPVLTNGQSVSQQSDVNGNTLVSEGTLISAIVGDSIIAYPFGHTSGRVTADGQILSGAGKIHTINIAPLTATPTAGLITVYDSLTETGTVIYSEWIFAITPGHTIILDKAVGTGIYVGYDAAVTNVQVDVSYRTTG